MQNKDVLDVNGFLGAATAIRYSNASKIKFRGLEYSDNLDVFIAKTKDAKMLSLTSLSIFDQRGLNFFDMIRILLLRCPNTKELKIKSYVGLFPTLEDHNPVSYSLFESPIGESIPAESYPPFESLVFHLSNNTIDLLMELLQIAQAKGTKLKYFGLWSSYFIDEDRFNVFNCEMGGILSSVALTSL